MVKRAQILLKSDHKAEGSAWKYEQICAAFQVTPVTVLNVRKSFVEKGMTATLCRKKPERTYAHALDGEEEARLVALACSEPPEGRKVWSLRLLKDRFIRLGYVDNISHETIRTVLKKRTQALAERAMVHCTQSERGVCVQHGRRFGGLQAPFG